MQKINSRFLLIPLFVLILILSIVFTTTGFVSAAENTVNLEMVFPNENDYASINSPTKVATNGTNVAIYDEEFKAIYIKGRFYKPISVGEGISSLQVSNDYVAYLQSRQINIKSVDGNDYTEVFKDFLIENGISRFDLISAFYLSNDAIYVLSNDEFLYKIAIQNNFKLAKPIKMNTIMDLFQPTAVKVFGNEIYYVKDKTLSKIVNDENSEILKFQDNIEYFKSTIIEYNSTGIIKPNPLTKIDLKVKDITDLKISENTMLIADKTSGTVKEYNIEKILSGEVEITAEYGKKGDDITKLNAPKQLAYDGGKTYVLDANNKAVKDITTKTVISYNFESAPTTFTVNNGVIYYATNENLIKKDIATEEEVKYEIKNISEIKPYKDGIIYVAENKAYTFNTESTPLNYENVEKISAHKDGDFIYVKNGLNIEKRLNAHIIATLSLSSANIIGIVDFEVDMHGNLFVLHKDEGGLQISYFKNNGSDNYGLPKTTALYNGKYDLVNPTDLTIVGDKLYVTDESLNAIFNVKSTALTGLIDNSENVTPTVKSGLLGELTPYKTRANSLLFTHQNNLELGALIENETIVWEFEDLGGKKFMLCNNMLGVIENKNLEKVEKTPVNKIAKGKHGAYSLYRYPLVSQDAKIDIASPEKITVLSKVEGFKNSFLVGDDQSEFEWYEVEFNGSHAFVLQTDLELIADVKPAEKTYSYMIVKSSSIGVTVKMYAEKNVNSEVIIGLKDGDKVTVIENCGEFVKVRFNDYEGYVLKANLIQDGLTKNQITAIVIASVTVVVAIVIFIYTVSLRKKQKQN